MERQEQNPHQISICNGPEIVIDEWGRWFILKAVACSCLNTTPNTALMIHFRYRVSNEWAELNEKCEELNGVWMWLLYV